MQGTAPAWRSSVVDQVSRKLREHILRKGLNPGDRLPTYRELEKELDVAYRTVKRGVDALVEDGVVKCIHGRGLFVGARSVRRRTALRSVLMAFPTSMHHVLSNAYANEMARGVLASLESIGIGCQTRSMMNEGIFFGDHVDGFGVDAVILMGVENDDYLRMAANWGRTIVALDYCSAAVPIDFVACDNRAAARRCVEHLARIGHRRLAYFGGTGVEELWMHGKPEESLIQRSSDVRERREGVLEAAAACGLPEPRLVQYGWEPLPGMPPEDALARLLSPAFESGAERPTAVLVESDTGVPGVMRWLAGRGLRVPQDVSVCAMAGASDTPEECPGRTYCRFDFRAMGRKGSELLRERFADPSEPVNRIHRVGFEWVEGRTCGARA